jgi:2-methylisocitrate lyase-like PEP mutase family enzyme
MVEKVQVACAARESRETIIIARTDARAVEGFEGALARGAAYAAAGADVVFVEALESDEEMREACRRINAPMMANMADGGKTPIRSVEELQALGFALAIWPAMTGLAAAKAVETALTSFKAAGTSKGVDLFSFSEFNQLIGFPEVWEFEKRWARTEAAE